MSGPKVVNIQALRRQQRREAIARFRELSAALESCQLLQNRVPADITTFRENTGALMDRLSSLREDSRWEELLAETTSYHAFYLQEAENLRQQVVTQRVAELRREHRQRQQAKMEACAIIEQEQRKKQEQEGAQQLVESARHYLDPATLATEQTLPRLPHESEDLRLERCWMIIGELELNPENDAATWKQKADTIASSSPAERALRLDSLVIELGSHLRHRKARMAASESVRATLSELQHLASPEAERWCEQLKAAQDSAIQCESIASLVLAARDWLAEEMQRGDAQEQRLAVLRALSSLGYEVREGMASAWAEQGRIVVHKPAEPIYGVEFSSPINGSAMQTRMVAEGEGSRTRQRDMEVEETWCGEFARLREVLASEGFKTNLVKANAPGTIPIKITPASGQNNRERISEKRPLSKQEGM